MPLEALYALMQEIATSATTPNVLTGQASFTVGQNIQLVTEEFFQSPSLKGAVHAITDDILGFCTLVLSYAKAANLVQAPDVSPKHWLTFMPRTEFNTIYAQVSSQFQFPLFTIFNILACYKLDSNFLAM